VDYFKAEVTVPIAKTVHVCITEFNAVFRIGHKQLIASNDVCHVRHMGVPTISPLP
jgi:hypothetical protein